MSITWNVTPPLRPPPSRERPSRDSSRWNVYGRGLRFAALAHPTVQLVRFLTKALLTWFVAVSTFGSLMLASLLVFSIQQIALLGLPEALIAAPPLAADDRLRLARRVRAVGLLGTGFGVMGGASLILLGEPTLGTWIVLLAPTILLSNLTLLPTAFLVRARAHRSVFAIDLRSVLAFSGTALALGALGFEAFAVIAGWYAQHVVQWYGAARKARRLEGPEGGRAAQLQKVQRHGYHLLGARLLEVGAERADSLVTGFLLGPFVLGLYELALHLSTFALHAVRSIADRALLPAMAEEHRGGRLGSTYLETQRLVLCFLIPAHVVLALVAVPLVETFFPTGWNEAGPLLAILALAAGVRSVELVALSALKAADRGRSTLFVNLFRLIAISGFLLGLLPGEGARTVALAVLLGRASSTLLALASASRLLDDRAAKLCPGLRGSAWSIATWIAVVTIALSSVHRLGLHAPSLLWVVPSLGVTAWFAIRWVGDPDMLREEWRHLRMRSRTSRERREEGR